MYIYICILLVGIILYSGDFQRCVDHLGVSNIYFFGVVEKNRPFAYIYPDLLDFKTSKTNMGNYTELAIIQNHTVEQ